jgi:hypothetical protein
MNENLKPLLFFEWCHEHKNYEDEKEKKNLYLNLNMKHKNQRKHKGLKILKNEMCKIKMQTNNYNDKI